MKIVCTVINDLAQDQRMHRICTSLAAAGHEVTLVGRTLPTSQPVSPRNYRTYRFRCKHQSGKRFYAEYNRQLYGAIRHWDYDVICAVDLDTLPAGYALTRRGDKKLVFDAHEWFSETPEVVNRRIVRMVWQQIGRRLAPAADLRYTVAPKLAERLAAEYGCDFGVVRNLPLRRSAEDHRPVRGRLLYQGMLNPGRGLEEAIRALALLPECELWIVGSGPEETRLRQLVGTLALHDRAKFLGFQPPEKLPDFTREAWLGLNLLEATSPSYYYSLANKSLDYVQSGVPSLQMDFPEYRALHARYGCYRLLKELTPEAIAAGVQALLDDTEGYERLRAANRAAAKELNWEREREVLLDLWAKL